MRRAILVHLLLLALASAAAPVGRADTFAGKPEARRARPADDVSTADAAGRSLPSDLRSVLWRIPTVYRHQLLSREGLRTLVYGAPFLGASFVEERAVSDGCRENRIGEDTVANELLDLIGDAIYPALPVPLYAIGRLLGEDRLTDLALDLATLTVAAFPELLLLRHIGDRPRPNGSKEFVFGVDTCSSFPSGHAVLSAGLARLAHDAYGWRVGVPLYLVAAAVGYQRLGAGEHYLADVVGGFLLGFSLADAIVRQRREERESSTLRSRIEVRPLAGGPYRALGVRVIAAF